ncbi:GNAT family N-acetyltransferase [Heyndrickxia sp. NPDC080065]|uniref:GNAT family N-acetyltransferase n=1 Tax=Heyndrickxia sp. NPDC080065 TaxID=3390568 RepID=UPI003D078E58
METNYEKIAYVWNEPKEKVMVPKRCQFKKMTTDLEEEFKKAISQIIINSLDRVDKKHNNDENRDEFVESIFQVDEQYFEYKKDWWELAYVDGELVGMIQPVVFKGAEKDGLMEGTIHYIGILPEFRGRGLINDLLLRTTRVLQDIGVWRIFADTDVENVPMQKAFEKAGYEKWK